MEAFNNNMERMKEMNDQEWKWLMKLNPQSWRKVALNPMTRNESITSNIYE